MPAYQGKCHCGQFEWTVDLDDSQSSHVLCHCDTCKILSGGAFIMGQVVPASALKLTKGATPGEYIYYGDSGKAVHCYYCPNCTTHIYHHQEVMGSDTYIARTGVLPEARKKFEPSAEIYGKDRYWWQKEMAQTFDVLPPS